MTSIYDRIGVGYAPVRRADPRIEDQIHRALAGARTVVNVGAGSGSYEPIDRSVVAVEPARLMISQRPDSGAAPVVCACAEALPFADASIDATMTVLSLHHWRDVAAGLREMARVSRQRILLLTWDPEAPRSFWLTRDYFPEFIEEDLRQFPAMGQLAQVLPGDVRVEPVPIHHDCTDGFLCAYWRRPDSYLDPALRRGISSFCKCPEATVEKGIARLADDLASGTWMQKHGACLDLESMDLGYRLVVSEFGS